MDLKQNKLSKAEWESIEVSVPEHEKKILKLIVDGYHDPNVRFNETQSLNSYIQFDGTPELDHLLYKKYFEEKMMKPIKKYGTGTVMEQFSSSMKLGKLKKLKSGEVIRLGNLEQNIEINKSRIFEFVLIELYTDLLKYVNTRKQKYAFYLYTLIQLKRASISHINVFVMELIDYTIQYVNSFTKVSEIITNAYSFIEQNKHILKYEDRALFNIKRNYSLFVNVYIQNRHLPRKKRSLFQSYCYILHPLVLVKPYHR